MKEILLDPHLQGVMSIQKIILSQSTSHEERVCLADRVRSVVLRSFQLAVGNGSINNANSNINNNSAISTSKLAISQQSFQNIFPLQFPRQLPPIPIGVKRLIEDISLISTNILQQQQPNIYQSNQSYSSIPLEQTNFNQQQQHNLGGYNSLSYQHSHVKERDGSLLGALMNNPSVTSVSSASFGKVSSGASIGRSRSQSHSPLHHF